MEVHEIVNLIVEKFGGNRVKFSWIGQTFVDFVVGYNEYRCDWNQNGNINVIKIVNETVVPSDNYSKWVEGILNNMVRNEVGEMVPR